MQCAGHNVNVIITYVLVFEAGIQKSVLIFFPLILFLKEVVFQLENSHSQDTEDTTKPLINQKRFIRLSRDGRSEKFPCGTFLFFWAPIQGLSWRISFFLFWQMVPADCACGFYITQDMHQHRVLLFELYMGSSASVLPEPSLPWILNEPVV